jgi:hypothetical protein
MPLVRIDVQERRTPAQVRRLADTVQEVLSSVSVAPPRHRYRTITANRPGRLTCEDTGRTPLLGGDP